MQTKSGEEADDDDFEMDEEFRAWLKKNRLLKKLEKVFVKLGIEDMNMLTVMIEEERVTEKTMAEFGVKPAVSLTLLKGHQKWLSS